MFKVNSIIVDGFRGSPSVIWHLVQVLGAVRVASVHWCPKATPCVSPHLWQYLAVVHVASIQLWPKAFPCVSPHFVHTLALRQVASCQICWCSSFLSQLKHKNNEKLEIIIIKNLKNQYKDS